MSGRRSRGLFGENDAEDKDDRNLFTRIIEGAILFGIACFVIRWGVAQLLCVRVPLIIIATVVLIIVAAYRTHKWRKKHDDF